jgi:hypothetical protein
MSTPSPVPQSNATQPNDPMGCNAAMELLPGCVTALKTGCFSPIAGILALVVALVTVVVYWTQFQDIRSRLETQQNSDWEQASVYTLVADAGHTGRTFDALFEDYSSDANDAIKHKRVTTKVLGKDEFRRVLMKLTAMRVIIPVGTTKYRIWAESDLCGCGYPAAEIINQMTPQSLAYLTKNNGNLDVSQVIQKFQTARDFQTETGEHIGPGEAQLLFIHLYQNRLIGVEIKTDGSLGNVWNLGARPDKAGSCFTGNWPILAPGPALLRPKPTPDDAFTPRQPPRDPMPRDAMPRG